MSYWKGILKSQTHVIGKHVYIALKFKRRLSNETFKHESYASNILQDNISYDKNVLLDIDISPWWHIGADGHTAICFSNYFPICFVFCSWTFCLEYWIELDHEASFGQICILS